MGSVPPTLTYSCCSRLLLLKKSISKMDIASKNEFIYFMQRAVEDQSNDCYIELYNLLLRAFVSADADFDGQVSQDEFGGMISAAAALPKKFGFDWWQPCGHVQGHRRERRRFRFFRRVAELCIQELSGPEGSANCF